jgi:hypothetical protein
LTFIRATDELMELLVDIASLGNGEDPYGMIPTIPDHVQVLHRHRTTRLDDRNRWSAYLG